MELEEAIALMREVKNVEGFPASAMPYEFVAAAQELTRAVRRHVEDDMEAQGKYGELLHEIGEFEQEFGMPYEGEDAKIDTGIPEKPAKVADSPNAIERVRAFLGGLDADAGTDEVLDSVGEILGDEWMHAPVLLEKLIELGEDEGKQKERAERIAEDADAFCDVKWLREDVTSAHKHCFGWELDRDEEGAEDYIDEVVCRIGDTLQDRLTEEGFEIIYDAMPERDFFEWKAARRAETGLKGRNAEAVGFAAKANAERIDGCAALEPKRKR